MRERERERERERKIERTRTRTIRQWSSRPGEIYNIHITSHIHSSRVSNIISYLLLFPLNGNNLFFSDFLFYFFVSYIYRRWWDGVSSISAPVGLFSFLLCWCPATSNQVLLLWASGCLVFASGGIVLLPPLKLRNAPAQSRRFLSCPCLTHFYRLFWPLQTHGNMISNFSGQEYNAGKNAKTVFTTKSITVSSAAAPAWCALPRVSPSSIFFC